MRIDVEKLCESYNNVRTAYAGRTGSPSWIATKLKESGISNSLCKRILREPTLIQMNQVHGQGRGNFKSCMFPHNPVHISWFKNWIYNKKATNQQLSFEEECSEYLKSQGYQLKKCVGFDEEAFKTDYPELYQKYLIYESI